MAVKTVMGMTLHAPREAAPRQYDEVSVEGLEQCAFMTAQEVMSVYKIKERQMLK